MARRSIFKRRSIENPIPRSCESAALYEQVYFAGLRIAGMPEKVKLYSLLAADADPAAILRREIIGLAHGLTVWIGATIDHHARQPNAVLVMERHHEDLGGDDRLGDLWSV